MKKNFLIVLLAALVGGVTAYAVVKTTQKDTSAPYVYSDGDAQVKNVNFSGEYPDFTYAAEMSVKAVVFVKVVKRIEGQQIPPSIFDYFFGYGGGSTQPREQVGSGSGVIISPDGYIATNNHVVAGASEIEVTMENNKTFKAELIGTDEATDIALLKVDATNLPTIPFGDSDKLRLGEWVLAIGSPYGFLTSTITAGIVSAKGRSMPANGEFKIESFIQTDAAVNPGNSGGALVNIKGELVGINTAIISNTGSYAGYSFAVPVNIVKKITGDLIDFGKVQRAMLGISMQNISEELMTEKSLSTLSGVYVAEVVKGGAADKAGVKSGDVLTAINGEAVASGSAVQEKINRYRPGEQVKLTILRGKEEKVLNATLIGKDTQDMNAYNMQDKINLFGAELVPAPKEKLAKLDLKSGVEVTSVEKGKMKEAGIKAGFIITYINNVIVASPQDVAAMVKKARRSILVEGVYPDGSVFYYGIGI